MCVGGRPIRHPGWLCYGPAPMQLWGGMVTPMLCLPDQLDMWGFLREEGEYSNANHLVPRKLDLGRWVLHGRGNFSFALGSSPGSGL